MAKSNYYWKEDTTKMSSRRFITLKLYSFSSAERLQSNLQKTKSEGHNINVISDIPTLQQFLDIVANFLFPLFPLENTKNSQIQIYKKSRYFTRSTKWVFTCFPVQKRSEVDLLSFHFSVCICRYISQKLQIVSEMYPNCKKRFVMNRKLSPQFLSEHKSFPFRIWLFFAHINGYYSGFEATLELFIHFLVLYSCSWSWVCK